MNINGVFYNRTTNASGIARLNINLDPGSYILTVESEINDLKRSALINVLETIKSSDLTKYYKNASQFYATILDNQGNPQANVTLTYNINGIFYSKVTDENGNARLNINLDSGRYIITIERLDTHHKRSQIIQVLPKLTGSDITTYYDGTANYEVRLLSDIGKADVGKTISAQINGKFYYATTDSNGVAKFEINGLNKGTYTITAYYNENTVSNSILVEPGYVTTMKNIGNPSSKKIAYVVGVHPLEHLTHETLVKLLPTIPWFNYCYDIYIVHVTADIGYYGDNSGDNSPGRQNGQYLVQKYVLPEIIKGDYKLAIDVHSNVGAYPYSLFVFSPVTGGLGEQYAKTVAKNSPSITHYQLSRTTSGPYLTIPLNQNGIPAFYYEEYSFASQTLKDKHMLELIYAVDNLKL